MDFWGGLHLKVSQRQWGGLNILTEQDLISTNQRSNDVSHAVWQKLLSLTAPSRQMYCAWSHFNADSAVQNAVHKRCTSPKPVWVPNFNFSEKHLKQWSEQAAWYMNLGYIYSFCDVSINQASGETGKNNPAFVKILTAKIDVFDQEK